MAYLRIFFISWALWSAPAWGHNAPCGEGNLTAEIDVERIAFLTNQLREVEKGHSYGIPQRLKIATWNTNLLNVRGWKSHYYRINSARLHAVAVSYLRENNPDIVMLQELWSEQDREVIRSVAALHDYAIVDDPPIKSSRHGMMTLVRKGAVYGIGPSQFHEFPNRSYVFFEWMGAVRRGILWTSLTLRDGQILFLANTHFTAFPKYNEVRKEQMQALSAAVKNFSQGMDHLIVAGDLNIAADFYSPKQKHMDRLRETRWLYQHFAQNTGLRDVFRAVELTDPGYTYNPFFKLSTTKKYKTASRRLDYIWAKEISERSRLHVLNAGVDLTDKVDGVYLSDHFLVHATVDLFQLP